MERSCGETEGAAVAGASETSGSSADWSSNATGTPTRADLWMGGGSASGGDRGRDLGSGACPISVSVSRAWVESCMGPKSVESGMAVSGVGSEAASLTCGLPWLARDSLCSAANCSGVGVTALRCPCRPRSVLPPLPCELLRDISAHGPR